MPEPILQPQAGTWHVAGKKKSYLLEHLEMLDEKTQKDLYWHESIRLENMWTTEEDLKKCLEL